MSKQVSSKCQAFDNHGLCPNRNDPMMKEYIVESSFVEGVKVNISFDKETEIDEKLCNHCDSFMPY